MANSYRLETLRETAAIKKLQIATLIGDLSRKADILSAAVSFFMEAVMRSIVKRSIVASGRKTSVSLEEPFWSSLRDLSRGRGVTLYQLITEIDANRQPASNLSSAIRLFVLGHFKTLAASPAG